MISPVVIMNLLGIEFFGELEFWMSGLKVVSLMGLFLLGIIIDLGGNPKHDRIGFRYWRQPNGPMGSYLVDEVHNKQLAVFLGFWSTLTTALFAYIGSELVAVTAGEAQNPRKTIPRAIKSTFFRIFVFYIGCVFAISLIVPSTSTVRKPIGRQLTYTFNISASSNYWSPIARVQGQQHHPSLLVGH